MPELPEVETIVRALRKPLVGRSFSKVTVLWPNSIKTCVKTLKSELPGKKIQSIERRGKYLRFNLSDNHTLFLHLKMSGDLLVASKNDASDPYARTIFSFKDGNELRFRDTRKFGSVHLVKNVNKVIGNLGPEPLDKSLTAQSFIELFQNRRGTLKPLLLDQTFIAGLGNIYVDESCFLSKIRPTKKVERIKPKELMTLYKAIQKVLTKAIKHNGSSFDSVYRGGNFQNHFAVYGRTNEPCIKCKSLIKRVILGGRSTHFCPNCQK